MSVSRSTSNVDVVSMIGTIVFKGTECSDLPQDLLLSRRISPLGFFRAQRLHSIILLFFVLFILSKLFNSFVYVHVTQSIA